MLRKQKKTISTQQAEKLNWLRLIRTENVGAITFHKLIRHYSSVEHALEALPELAARGGRKKPLVAPHPSDIEREYEALLALGGDLITLADNHYPEMLKRCDDAPPVLSYIGNLTLLARSSVSIVGARNASLNGRKMAEKLAHDLGQRQHIIASGLARGIDTAAHTGSLSSGTIAVIAGGLDIVYPPENTALYEQIKEQGLILAESPLGTAPQARHFPKRNRIVSGLSRATIVIEATLKSGSLITARMAAEQGRDVMAIPGSPFDPRAAGPNHLIREGATLIRNAQDVLEMLTDFSDHALREPAYIPSGLEQPLAANESIADNAHETVLENLSFTAVRVDELLRACDMSIPVMQTILLELELAGRIERLPGNRVILKNENEY